MQSEKNKRSWKGLLGFFAVIGVVVTLFMSISSGMFATAAELGNIITGENTSTKATQDGCAIKIETTEKVAWKLPRQPIDLVILQDTSGSFENTIGKVQTALKELTKPVALKDYNENKPRLVFTGDEDTTDRVMINTYQGIDGYNYYSDHDFKNYRGYAAQFKAGAEYKYNSSALMSDETTINQVIDRFKVAGGTPTVPAIDDTIDAYNKIKGDMKNNRKTVFLLITDGIANGYRSGNQVLMDRSDSRGIALRAEFVRLGLRNNEYTPEAQQDYISRAKELKDAAQRLEDLVKSDDGNTKNDGAVVVGFWEDVPIFTTGNAYGTVYEDGSVFEKVGIDVGPDKRSVQAVFHEAIKSVATDDSYYVNEQKDIQAFSEKILKAVGQALVKEDVSGEFEVTEGYTVESVTINGKKVVSEVKDEKTEIRGTVKQDGRKVTISVPESVFNLGDNKFDYELKRTEEAEKLDEADEEAPPANYVPPKVKREVGQLVGTFQVGEYKSAQIGSKEPTKVEVTDLKYCYPRATKDVKDQDPSNDQNGDEGKGGFIAQDPLLVNEAEPKKTIKRSSYAATLTEEGERFTYSVDYNMYNVALEMERNVMFVDALDYRVKFIDAKVTDETGTVLPEFKVSTKATQDSQKRDNTTVIATVPEKAGEKTATVDEGNYGSHKFKKYRLVITAEIKDQYKLAQNATEYYKMMQENEGRGFANQASIVWNGTTDDPTDPDAKVRRSNNVFVTPPLDTDVTKKVSQTLDATGAGSEHLNLPTADDTYYYTIDSTWPGLFDEYMIEDILVPELQSLHADGEDKVYVNGKEATTLAKYLKVDQVQENGKTHDRVYLRLNKDELSRAQLLLINREITKLNEGNDGPAKIRIGFKAKIREDADLSQYRENGTGDVKVPNDAKVTLNNKSKTTKKVTVTPPGMPPKPEKTVDTKPSLALDTFDQVFTYEVKATVPKEVTGFTKFEISDDLEDILTITDTKVTVDGKTDASVVVTSAADANANTATKGLVIASLPKDKIADYKGQEMVLTIKARIKEGVTSEELGQYVDTSIPNKATLKVGDKPNQSEDTENVPVTPPGETPTPTKTVDNQASLNLAGLAQEFTYRVKATVPQNIAGFTKFELSDDLEDILTVKEIKVLSAGQEDTAIDVTSVAKANTDNGLVTATIAKDALPNYAGKEITLEIKARIKEDVKGEELAKYVTPTNTAGSIPNKATLTVGDKPSQKKETEEVPVTPPGDTPNVSKKINETLDSAVVLPEADYTYNIKSTLPKDIFTYKKFNIVDEVDERLTVKGTPVIKGEAANFFKVTVTGQTVTAEITDFAAAKAYAAKEVELIITAQVKKDATVKKGENGIPNQAKVQYRNKSRQDGEPDEETPPTPPVTVTPPPLTKKINDTLDHLDIPSKEDYKYNIKTTIPTDIVKYKKFVITDTLDKDLMVKGTPSITGDVAKFFDVKVDGQTVTATMKDFAKAGDFAGKEVELVIPAQIREGVTRVKIPNTTKVVYHNPGIDDEPERETPPTPPVTVTPPTDPTVDKKINGDKDHLDVPVQTDYTYNIKASLPTTITSYKKFVITDTLDKDLMVKGTPSITGDVAKFFDVKVDGQTVTATMKDFAKAGDFAGKEVELVIPAQIREGVTRVKIPNTTKVVYHNPGIDDEPERETPPTPPVTVTPPTDPTVDKKINGDKDHLDVPVQTDYTY
ncbi:isopeptide-forming domain-containing fimbrial protein, partial [Streptococcus pluranimalium]